MKKRMIIMIIGIEAVIIAAVIVLLLYINSDTVRINHQLELAQRYLLEEDYEQAIAAFEIIIEIDPKNVDAYLGLAEAYVSADELGNAVRTLEKAAEQTDSEEVLDMLEIHTAEIEQRQLAAQKAADIGSTAEVAASMERATAETPELETEITSHGYEVDDTFQVYKDFLLNTEIDQGSDFPIWGYYLFDMNFDGIPELGVLHHSGGSMGGYFTFYRYDGQKIIPAVLDKDGNPVQVSNYTQILADHDSGKVYFLKEMYLLRGNENGTYGYIREITNENGILHCNNLLKLEVACDFDAEIAYEIQHDREDDFLSDKLAAEYLVTESYAGGAWEQILPEEYLARKREMIPEENSFVDIRNTDAYVLLCDSVYELMDDDWNFHNRRMTEEEIDTLFEKFYAEKQ